MQGGRNRNQNVYNNDYMPVIQPPTDLSNISALMRDFMICILNEGNDFLISDSNFNLIYRYLAEEMDKEIETGKSPAFAGSTREPDMIQITCKDEVTYNWLKSLGPKLPNLWPGSELYLLTKQSIKRTKIATMIPGEYCVLDLVIKRLIGQNPSLKVKDWIVSDYRKIDGAGYLVLSLDQDSIQEMILCKYKLFYLFTEICFRLEN